jgi:hypothetical protein
MGVNMLVSILLGLALGIGNVDWTTSVFLLLFAVCCNASYEIGFSKNLITGTDSPYKMYVENLGQVGRSQKRAWVRYLLQSILVFVPIGMVCYGLVRLTIN